MLLLKSRIDKTFERCDCLAYGDFLNFLSDKKPESLPAGEGYFFLKFIFRSFRYSERGE